MNRVPSEKSTELQQVVQAWFEKKRFADVDYTVSTFPEEKKAVLDDDFDIEVKIRLLPKRTEQAAIEFRVTRTGEISIGIEWAERVECRFHKKSQHLTREAYLFSQEPADISIDSVTSILEATSSGNVFLIWKDRSFLGPYRLSEVKTYPLIAITEQTRSKIASTGYRYVGLFEEVSEKNRKYLTKYEPWRVTEPSL